MNQQISLSYLPLFESEVKQQIEKRSTQFKEYNKHNEYIEVSWNEFNNSLTDDNSLHFEVLFWRISLLLYVHTIAQQQTMGTVSFLCSKRYLATKKCFIINFYAL